jgi:HNH endonuclease
MVDWNDMRSYVSDRSIPEPNTGCWIWCGQLDVYGYGQFRKTRKDTWHKAHRVALEAYSGRIPDGLNALHSCNQRCCVNPDHLYAGTQLQNVADQYFELRRDIAKALPQIKRWGRNGTGVTATAKRLGIAPSTLWKHMGG